MNNPGAWFIPLTKFFPCRCLHFFANFQENERVTEIVVFKRTEKILRGLPSERP